MEWDFNQLFIYYRLQAMYDKFYRKGNVHSKKDQEEERSYRQKEKLATSTLCQYSLEDDQVQSIISHIARRRYVSKNQLRLDNWSAQFEPKDRKSALRQQNVNHKRLQSIMSSTKKQTIEKKHEVTSTTTLQLAQQIESKREVRAGVKVKPRCLLNYAQQHQHKLFLHKFKQKERTHLSSQIIPNPYTPNQNQEDTEQYKRLKIGAIKKIKRQTIQSFYLKLDRKESNNNRPFKFGGDADCHQSLSISGSGVAKGELGASLHFNQARTIKAEGKSIKQSGKGKRINIIQIDHKYKTRYGDKGLVEKYQKGKFLTQSTDFRMLINLLEKQKIQ